MRKYYPGLTLFKFSGAVLVLLTHIRAFPLNDALNGAVPGFTALCSVVVPGFYLMAGFLATKGWLRAARPGQYVRQYVVWIGRVYALFCVLQFFTDPLSVVRTGSLAHRSWQYYIEPLLIWGPYPQLWFILPLLAAVGLGYWAERRGQLLSWGGLVLLGFGLAVSLLGPLRGPTRQVFGDFLPYHHRHWALVEDVIRHYLGYALPFVTIGIGVAKYEDAFLRLNKWLLIGPAALASVAELALIRALQPPVYNALLFAHLPLTTLLFYGLLKVQSPWVRPYHGYLRRLSLFMFFLHWPLIYLDALLLGTSVARLSPGQTGLCIVLVFSQILLLERVLAWLPRKGKAEEAVAVNA